MKATHIINPKWKSYSVPQKFCLEIKKNNREFRKKPEGYIYSVGLKKMNNIQHPAMSGSNHKSSLYLRPPRHPHQLYWSTTCLSSNWTPSIYSLIQIAQHGRKKFIIWWKIVPRMGKLSLFLNIHCLQICSFTALITSSTLYCRAYKWLTPSLIFLFR